MLHLAKQIAETAAFVRAQWSATPKAGVILGSGLGDFANEIEAAATIPYADLPHFPHTTAIGHAGRLVCGTLAGAPIIAFQGRFHLYEGHSAETASLPVRLLAALGGRTLIVSNAAGGLNPQYATGDVMLIDDQINFMFRNPLVGVNDDELGPRFPDMCAPYDKRLQRRAVEVAMREGFLLHRGVYASVLGPNYETRAEYRMLRRLGGDAVGMSTVPEVIAAVHAGMRVLGLSTITNVGSPDALSGTTGHEVLSVAATAGAKLSAITRGVVETLQ
jgi:purine-nucleoside phosphorylase